MASSRYLTMPRPVSQPLLSSWKNTTMPYAVHHVRERTSEVRSTSRSVPIANSTAIVAAAV